MLDFYEKEMCHFLNFKFKQPPSLYFGMSYLILTVPLPPTIFTILQRDVCVHVWRSNLSIIILY